MSGSDYQTPETMTLVLIRHGESVWNKANLFTGWEDVDLAAGASWTTPEGITITTTAVTADHATVTITR